MINKNLFERYNKYLSQINGWLSIDFLDYLYEIEESHENNGIKGNILEIGVFLGKTFIPLSFLLKEEERIVGVDCFNNQEVNVSKSGFLCHERRVEHNIKQVYLHKVKELNFKLIKGDSRTLKPEDYLNFTDNKLPYRLIHIDGGHDYDTCTIDLNNSSKILCKYGYLLIDDYYGDNPFSESIVLATNNFLLINKNFKIIKIQGNKLILQNSL